MWNIYITDVLHPKELDTFLKKYIFQLSYGIWPQSHQNWKKWFFSDFVKKIFFSKISRANNCFKAWALCIDESHKKIHTILMNFYGISDIGLKRWPKREKIKGTCKQFSWTFLQWFFNILYFSHRGNVPKIMGKIQVLQKRINLFPGKLFAFKICKIRKNGILLNFDQIYLNKDKSYKLWNL